MTEISSPDKVIFPADGLTKADLVGHYRTVAERMLPHVAGRPLTLHRFPNGIGAKGFLQKNAADYFPDSIERVEVPKKDGVTRYPVVRDAAALAYLANLGTVTFHVWTSRLPDLDRPDRLVFDLDPPAGEAAAAAAAARVVRGYLADLGLATAPMTTGSKGYHVVTTLDGGASFRDTARFGQASAALLAAAEPDLLTDEFKLAKRDGRVFVDWLRNTGGATGVAAWSLRARSGAPVAVPFPWDELDRTPPQRWKLDTVAAALDRSDPILALTPQALAPALSAVEERLERHGIELQQFDRFRS